MEAVGGDVEISQNPELCQTEVDAFVVDLGTGAAVTTAPGNDGICELVPAPLSVERASSIARGGDLAKMRFQGNLSPIDVSGGFVVTAGDGSGELPPIFVAAEECTATHGYGSSVVCTVEDPTSRQKVLRAYFRPGRNGREGSYRLVLRPSGAPASLSGPLSLRIEEVAGAIYQGQASRCATNPRKVVCR